MHRLVKGHMLYTLSNLQFFSLVPVFALLHDRIIVIGVQLVPVVKSLVLVFGCLGDTTDVI